MSNSGPLLNPTLVIVCVVMAIAAGLVSRVLLTRVVPLSGVALVPVFGIVLGDADYAGRHRVRGSLISGNVAP